LVNVSWNAALVDSADFAVLSPLEHI
jgi:hypothetical protein